MDIAIETRESGEVLLLLRSELGLGLLSAQKDDSG